MPVQNHAEEILFALAGRLQYRERMLTSQSVQSKVAKFNTEERNQYIWAQRMVLSEAGGDTRFEQICLEAQAFSDMLFKQHYVRQHDKFKPTSAHPARDFSAARKLFIEEATDKQAALQQAGFTNENSMQLVLNSEARESAWLYQRLSARPASELASVIATRNADYGTQTAENMVERLARESIKKGKGELGETGAQTSEGFLKELLNPQGNPASDKSASR